MNSKCIVLPVCAVALSVAGSLVLEARPAFVRARFWGAGPEQIREQLKSCSDLTLCQ